MPGRVRRPTTRDVVARRPAGGNAPESYVGHSATLDARDAKRPGPDVPPRAGRLVPERMLLLLDEIAEADRAPPQADRRGSWTGRRGPSPLARSGRLGGQFGSVRTANGPGTVVVGVDGSLESAAGLAYDFDDAVRRGPGCGWSPRSGSPSTGIPPTVRVLRRHPRSWSRAPAKPPGRPRNVCCMR
jgi:hypothetical protein